MKRAVLVVLMTFFLFSITSKFVIGGNINTDNKYVWGENIGWIDFGLDIGNVDVSDSEITGYAYSDNMGWISLNCKNTNTCNSVNYGVINNNGDLSGYAWGENIGWINFNGVSIDEVGSFSGYAYGENIGYLSFNCNNTNTCDDLDFKLKTDWNKSVYTPPVVIRSGGGGGRPTRPKEEISNNDETSDLPAQKPSSDSPQESSSVDNKIEYSFSRDLYLGASGPDVKKLQEFLNKNGYIIVSSGPGSPRGETEFFGELTRQALIKFQQANNIFPAIGYLGPKTKALLTNY